MLGSDTPDSQWSRVEPERAEIGSNCRPLWTAGSPRTRVAIVTAAVLLKTRVFMNAVVIIICADEQAMLGVNLRLDKERHLHTDTLNNQHATSFASPLPARPDVTLCL